MKHYQQIVNTRLPIFPTRMLIVTSKNEATNNSNIYVKYCNDLQCLFMPVIDFS